MDKARNEVRDYLHDQEARRLAELEEQIKMAQPWDAPDIFGAPYPDDEAEKLAVYNLLWPIGTFIIILLALVGALLWGMFS